MAKKKSMQKKVTKKTVSKKTVKKQAKKIVKLSGKVEEPIILQPVRGMRDILPGEQPYWQQVRKVLENSAIEYGFSRIDTPVVEYENLFTRPIGEGSDVIDKELYSFKSRSRDNVALRPEFTTSIARAYIQHGMNILPKPVKLFSMGRAYRYEKPQEGNYREFRQGNFEIFGEDDPILDAQIIQMSASILKNLGIKNVQFHVNSIGTVESRKEYFKLLRSYFNSKKHKLSSRYRDLIKTNPMRIVCRFVQEHLKRLII